MRARAVGMVPEHQGSDETQSAAVAAIAAKIGGIPATLKVWVRQAERDSGARDCTSRAERDRIKALARDCARFGKPTGYCARRPRILLRRNSTARSSHDRLH